MKLGILIPTYRKANGEYRDQIAKTLESVSNQTHKDYKVFLIGDLYDDNYEFEELSKIIDPSKIWAHNLPIAYERSKYSGKDLWVTGGVYASNIGIDQALKEGFDYICHLDHDDLWKPNHLELISTTRDLQKCIFFL